MDLTTTSLAQGELAELLEHPSRPRSIIPDQERYPCFTQFDPAAIVEDGDEGPRTPSMSGARVREDLGRIVAAAEELLRGSLGYERSLKDYFAALLAAHGSEALCDLVDRQRAHPY